MVTLGLLVTVGVTAFAADNLAPTDVENLTATAGDASVTLEWSVATDPDGSVDHYDVDYGTASDDYDVTEVNAGSGLTYTVTGLTNGTTYYFSVLAIDNEDLWSANYSNEVSATPVAGGDVDDVDAPTVVAATSIDKTHIEVEFSEPIKFDSWAETNPESAFSISDVDAFVQLEVLDAEIMADQDVDDGKEGLMVLLTTEEQTLDADYTITAGIGILDLADNSIDSGTSDTASFDGSAIDPEDADTTAPELTDIEVVDSRNLILTFDEPVILSLYPVEDFEVYVKGSDGIDALNVVAVELQDDYMTVLVNVSEMDEGVTYVIDADVQDEAGNDVSENAYSLEFAYGAGGEVDVDPVVDPDAEPEEGGLNDAAKFAGKFVKDDETLSVLLSWTLPNGEVSVAQKLYRSDDKGITYGNSTGLDSDLAKLEVTEDLNEGDVLWFKLTQEDADGNESKGVLAKVTLSETGPGIAGLLLVSLGLGRVVGRKKRK